MKNTRELTCIVCPRGCTLKVALSGTEIVSCEGNACKRGLAYAESECKNPTRTVTSTVRCSSGELVPVKTSKPIPKGMIFEAMKEINKTHPELPLAIGDVIIANILDTGADMIVTGHASK